MQSTIPSARVPLSPALATTIATVSDPHVLRVCAGRKPRHTGQRRAHLVEELCVRLIHAHEWKAQIVVAARMPTAA